MFKRQSRTALGREDRIAGDLARDSKKWSNAVASYEAYLSHNPNDFGILVQLGNCAKESGNFEKSFGAYQIALTLKPDEPDVHLQLGHLQKRMGRMNAAKQSFQTALELDPTLADARHELAMIDRSTASLPFYLFSTYLDSMRNLTIDQLINQSRTADLNDDPFYKYAELIRK